MKIVCLGGGPAGLYFSILAKKASPSWDITVVERNRPDSTFGWGVVFSDKTMGGFRDADPETHSEITMRSATGTISTCISRGASSPRAVTDFAASRE